MRSPTVLVLAVVVGSGCGGMTPRDPGTLLDFTFDDGLTGPRPIVVGGTHTVRATPASVVVGLGYEPHATSSAFSVVSAKGTSPTKIVLRGERAGSGELEMRVAASHRRLDATAESVAELATYELMLPHVTDLPLALARGGTIIASDQLLDAAGNRLVDDSRTLAVEGGSLKAVDADHLTLQIGSDAQVTLRPVVAGRAQPSLTLPTYAPGALTTTANDKLTQSMWHTNDSANFCAYRELDGHEVVQLELLGAIGGGPIDLVPLTDPQQTFTFCWKVTATSKGNAQLALRYLFSEVDLVRYDFTIID